MAFLPDNLVKLIKQSGITHKENAISFIFTCPKCNKKDKLYIKKSTGQFICFFCVTTVGFKGKSEYALNLLLERPYKDIQKDIYDNIEQKAEAFIKVNIKDFEDDDEIEKEIKVLETFTYPLDYYELDHEFSIKGAEYLRSRGLNVDYCKEYDIRYSPTEQRIVFPVKENDIIYGWQKRTITNNSNIPKILGSKHLPKNQTLMFIDRIKGLDYTVLCEGPVDALSAHLCGGNVATMGKQVSEGQMLLLLNNNIKKVYLALDPDAYVEMDNLYQKWKHVFDFYLMQATKKDLGEMNYEEVYSLFKSAPKIEPHYIFSYFKGDV